MKILIIYTRAFENQVLEKLAVLEKNRSEQILHGQYCKRRLGDHSRDKEAGIWTDTKSWRGGEEKREKKEKEFAAF